MKGILIADAGSSKTDWSFLPEETGDLIRFNTPGINPLHDSTKTVNEKCSGLKNCLKSHQIKHLYYFGAGCASKEINDSLKAVLNSVFKADGISVNSDMLAAAIALFGGKKGIAAILGTGSNSCLYEKGEIKAQIPSLGYILGDEGGGVSLGKRLLNAVFKKQLSLSLQEDFKKEYQIEIPELLKKVYSEEKPAKFIASFAPFLLKNIEYPEIRNIVEEEFKLFFMRNILPYGDTSGLKVGFVGSIAFNFRDILRHVARQYRIVISDIIATPISALEYYYSGK